LIVRVLHVHLRLQLDPGADEGGRAGSAFRAHLRGLHDLLHARQSPLFDGSAQHPEREDWRLDMMF
ncbi:unnamed protein product, partial [Symbiodinium sp. CCMP2456]